MEKKFKEFLMKEIFDFKRGRVISKLYIEKHRGQYPIFSSAIENYGIMDYIDTYDFDGLYITWGTDNTFTPRPREGKFSCTNVCGTMKPKSESATFKGLLYICGALRNSANMFNWTDKASSTAVSNLSVLLPVKQVCSPDFDALHNILISTPPGDFWSARFRRRYCYE